MENGDPSKADSPKQDPPKTDAPKQDPPKTDAPKQDPPNTDAPKQDPPKTGTPKQDPPKTDAPKQDPPKTDAPKQDPPKTDAPKQDPPMTDVPKQDPPKRDTQKSDSPKPDTPKSDPPMPDPHSDECFKRPFPTVKLKRIPKKLKTEEPEDSKEAVSKKLKTEEPEESKEKILMKLKTEELEDSEEPVPKKLKTEEPEDSEEPNKPPSANNQKLTKSRLTYGESFRDPALPKELTKLLGALKCELCNVAVNSTIHARMHYTGKQHEKKVTAFLLSWCKETGKPMPNLSSGSSKNKKLHNPDNLYCEICDIPLTSVQHAQQHNMGRSHLRRARSGHTPIKRTFFNKDTGKWEKLPKAEADDPTGRFGIGMGFLSPESTTAADEWDAPTTDYEPPPPPPPKGFFCELCQVATTSQEQLDVHLEGSKHRKKVRNLHGQVGNGASSLPTESTCAPTTDNDSPSKNQRFFCELCQVSATSQENLNVHMGGSKHRKKAKNSHGSAVGSVLPESTSAANESDALTTGNKSPSKTERFFCDLCQVPATSQENLDMHLKGAKHRKKAAQFEKLTSALKNK